MVLENFLVDVDILWDRVGKELFDKPQARTGRKMRVRVVNKGVIEDLTGYTLNLGWKSTTDETKFGLDAFTAVDITKGIFELEYTSGMLTNIGTLKAALQLVPVAGNAVESDNFVITVTKSAVDAEAIQSETSFTALALALVDVNAWNATIDGKVIDWEADMAATKQLYIDNMNEVEATYPQELLSLGSQLAEAEKHSEGWINIKESPYNAVGDGVADDTLAIQSAIDAAALGSGKVFAPQGTYNHSTLSMKTNVHIVGTGYRTIFNNTTNASSIKIGHATEYVFYTKVANLYLKGVKTNANNHGIEYFGHNPAYSVIESVYIRDMGGHGIYGGHDGHVNNVEIDRCFISGCTGDGVNMQYGLGQVNAVWIRNNNIVDCNNGVLFFGNNIIVESNSIQVNRKYGVSVGDNILSTLKYCYASSISDNYFELNGASVSENAAVIGIFAGYADGAINNKIIRNLKIASNNFGESGSKYASLIYVEDLKDSPIASESCVLQTYNNYSPNLKLITYNKSTALSMGCVLDEGHYNIMPAALVSSLPAHVTVRGFVDSQYNKIISKGTENTVALTAGNTGILKYSKTGTGKVWLRGYFVPTAIASGLVIGTLSSGFYNANYQVPLLAICNAGAGTVTEGVVVDAAGQIKILNPAATTIANGYAVYVNVSFYI